MEQIDDAMTESDTRVALLEMARGKTGSIPADLLVDQVIAVTVGGDWPVRREAMLAVLRRAAFGRRDDLVVRQRPNAGRPFGIYRTGRRRSLERPYDTFLAGVRPLGASCNCPDYLRNSLGLCKHVLTVLNDLHKRPRVLRQALQASSDANVLDVPAMLWDPIRPLVGMGDWLERVTVHLGGNPSLFTARQRAIIDKRFAAGPPGCLVLRSTFPNHPKDRLDLVQDLFTLIVPTRQDPAPLATVPAVGALLAPERDRLRQIVAQRWAPRELDREIGRMRQKPYAYQVDGVRHFLAAGRLLLADDMGLGKTAQAITACHVLHSTERVERGVLIVPAALKPQWFREWAAFTDTPLTLVDGSPDERRSIYRQTKDGYLLLNYEQLLRDFESVVAWKPDFVVLDEAQRIKNWATKSATYVKQLDPPYRLVLTGTPMENRIEELASLYDWVDGFTLEPKWRLVPWHMTAVDGGRDIGGARNLDTLRERLGPTMLRRTRQEVLDQLPSRTDTVVPVEMTPAQVEEHDALRMPIVSLMHRARRRPLTQAEFLKLMQLLTTQRIIANGLAQYRFQEIWPELSAAAPDPVRLEGLATPKLFELRELIEQLVILQQRKVVVFSQWRRMLQLAAWATQDVLAKAGKRAVFFTGQEGAARRTQNLVELHDDPSACVLFASDAGGVGLNLQKAASCCINLDLPWNPAVLEQRIGRIYRLGQKRPIDVYNLVSQDSIEARIAAVVADKKALFTSLFDGSSDEVHFDRFGSFVSQLERVVDPAPVSVAEELDLEPEESALGREVEQLVATADESTDMVSPQFGSHDPADRAPTPAGPPTPAMAVDFADLFRQVRIQTRPDGSLSIEAPPDAAQSLASVFEEMARMLRTQRP